MYFMSANNDMHYHGICAIIFLSHTTSQQLCKIWYHKHDWTYQTNDRTSVFCWVFSTYFPDRDVGRLLLAEAERILSADVLPGRDGDSAASDSIVARSDSNLTWCRGKNNVKGRC